jgi:hypothetical protein
MVKHIKTKSKSVNIHRLGWFYECIFALANHPDKIILHLEKNTLIEPSGYALIELMSNECKLRKIDFQIKGFKLTALTSFPHHDAHYSIDWFEGSLKPLFIENFLEKQKNHLSEDLAYDFRLLFSELTQNAKDHSGAEKFLVFLERTGIGVFDLGVSIPGKLIQRYPFKDDMAALELSLKEGITTRRLRSGGLGLYYSLELLKRNEGIFTLVSGSAQLKRFVKNKKIDRKKLKTRFPGTLIYCELKKKDPS